ncbi:hypothetical protein FBU59_002675 [Linderina macrospora]|uniref:Uncharacterized protein n=1 Tax=Linderina macrospora TaxID=4868 RepID=A0ACC1JAI6_9FUNG|nr:hypothetical protein FBU59_002675 [Linderina macrospora]
MTMAQDDKEAMYTLLRPDGRFVRLLIQYYSLQREHNNLGDMMIAADTMPPEYNGLMELGPYYKERKVVDAKKDNKVVGFRVGALEYLLFHICRAVLPPRESAISVPSSLYPDQRSRRVYFAHSGTLVNLLIREYIEVFVPVAVPGVKSESQNRTERNPIDQLRHRIHDFSPMRHNESQKTARAVGTMDRDILDVMDFSILQDLTGYFVDTAVLLWLPIVPMDVRTAIMTGKPSWTWIPNESHLAGLNMFNMLVGYFAKGERQMELFLLPGTEGSNIRQVANQAQIDMNGRLRSVLRVRCMITGIEDMLGLVLGSCARSGSIDVGVWLGMLHHAAQIWIRFALPWRSSAQLSMADTANMWVSRLGVMAKNLQVILYVQMFALFIKQLTGPSIDLLDRTSSFPEGKNDILSVIDRVLSSFTDHGLRSMVYIIEQKQLDANAPVRSQYASAPGPPIWESAGASISERGSPARGSHHEPLTQFENQVMLMYPGTRLVGNDLTSLECKSMVLKRVLYEEFGDPPLVSVFTSAGELMPQLVRALHTADLLAVRQRQMLVPQDTTDQARSVVRDLFAVLQRILSAGSDTPSSLSMSSTNNAIQRSRQLHEAQKRIAVLYGKTCAAFGVSRRAIQEITERMDESMRLSPMYADRPNSNDRGAEPEMSHGNLTQRGRWQLKTGRRKFTAQSLMESPQIIGPRALYEAKSYESQWVLDRVPQINDFMNRWYQKLMESINAKDMLGSSVVDYRLDFRWLAMYQNMCFFGVFFLVILLFRLIFY